MPDESPLSSAVPRPAGRRVGWHAAGHVVAGAWIAVLLISARLAPDRYWDAMQEDRVVEWWTALLFLAAGALALPRAVRRRRAGDALVALFCVAAAGEELSWGQRAIGYTPPAAFLEHNTQQELNLHNFRDVVGQPKWLLAGILAGYGVLVPVLARTRRGARFLEAVRLTAPPLAAAPWFAVAIALLAWYPVEFTGEWVETLAAGLFLVTIGASATVVATAAVVALGAAGAIAFLSTQRSATPELLACAGDEVRALAADLASSATPRLRRAGRVHKRVLTAARDGYVRADAARALARVTCAGTDSRETPTRRRFAVDPWGTAYWLVSDDDRSDQRYLVVYSFGPNRRRDGEAGVGGGDDILARVEMPRSRD